MIKKTRLQIIVFASIVMVAVMALLFFWRICNQKFFELMAERIVDDYAQTTIAIEKNVETMISYTEDFAKYLAQNERVCALIEQAQESSADKSSVRTSQNEWADISSRLIYSTSKLAGFCAYSEEELLYSFYNSSTGYNTDVIFKEDLERVKEEKAPFWTDLITLQSTTAWSNKKEYVFSVLKYVQGERGEHLGTVALFVRESNFSNAFSSMESGEKQQFYLVDEDGTILSAVDKSCLYQDARNVLQLTQEQYQTCMEQEQLLVTATKKVPILYMSKKIQGTRFCLVGQTVLEELELQKKEIGFFMRIILILTLGAAIVFSWIVSKQVTRPIEQIIIVMQQLENCFRESKLRCPVNGTVETRLLGTEFNRLMDRVEDAAEEIYQEQRLRRHNEVRLLQAQIVPHFLYNTLGMISSLIRLNRLDQAQEAIQNLSSFYRLSLSNGKEQITLAEELTLTRL